MKLLRKLYDTISYDADRDFYGQIFPESVTETDMARIRKMDKSDLANVLAIERKIYNFPWSEGIFKDCFKIRYSCWVCESLDTLMGYCILSTAPGEAHVMNLGVSPDEQGKGYGRKMMTHLIEVATKSKAETLFLEVRPSNPNAIALYESLGFNEVGIRKDYYKNGEIREDAIIFAYEIYQNMSSFV